MDHRRFFRVLSFLLIFALLAGAFALAEEDVSITIYDNQGNVVAGEGTPVPSEDGEDEAEPLETPEPTRDPSLPVYEQDGSILLTLSFTGDVTIGTNVQASSSIFEKELKKQKGDITFPFRNVRDIFLADDMTMVNFEGTLTTAGKNPKKRDYSFLFRADPSYVAMLPAGGIDTVSFENNHADDMGEEGLKETKETLLAAGIPYASEDEPAIMTVKGVKIGSLAYQTFNGRHDDLMEKVPGDIAALRAQGCEFIVVSYHWGAEKDYSPNDNQVRLGRATIDAGADLVVGHHSHRINPIEYYNGKYICYSLGNFSFAGNNKPDDMSSYILPAPGARPGRRGQQRRIQDHSLPHFQPHRLQRFHPHSLHQGHPHRGGAPGAEGKRQKAGIRGGILSAEILGRRITHSAPEATFPHRKALGAFLWKQKRLCQKQSRFFLIPFTTPGASKAPLRPSPESFSCR